MSNPANEASPVTVVLGASSPNGAVNCPSYAAFEATAFFVARLKKLQLLCTENGLSEVRQSDSVNWGPGEEIDFTELCVLPNGSFWFAAQTDGDECVETLACDITHLLASLAAAGGDTVVYPESEGFDPSIRESFEEYNTAPSTCDDCGAEERHIIGCPDGAEICQSCFDNGQH
jgi:hypothetical protein